jgi:hypothetical protein
VLDARMRRFDFDVRAAAGLGFFARQAAFRAWLVDDLLSRHRVAAGETTAHTLHRLARLTLDREDRARVAEAVRLGGFSADVYDRPTLTQEEIAESLKRLRASLVRDGLRNALRNALPKPYGPRVAHIRVPEPIRIDVSRADDASRYRDDLLALTRATMQRRLDALGREIAPERDRFRVANPFYAGATASRPSASAPPASTPPAGAALP